MEYKILLDKSENIRQVEAEEQTRFVVSIIEALEIPFDWNSNEPFTVLDKVRMRKLLGQYNVSVIDDMEGGVKIYLDRDPIAEWNKPFFILKEDPSQLERSKRLFIEMQCSFNSIFEQKETESMTNQ